MKFRKLPVEIEAHRWHRLGDHPEDGDSEEEKIVFQWRRPGADGNEICPVCGSKMLTHGWIGPPQSGNRVCPGDWIITAKGGGYHAWPDKVLRAHWEEIPS